MAMVYIALAIWRMWWILRMRRRSCRSFAAILSAEGFLEFREGLL